MQEHNTTAGASALDSSVVFFRRNGQDVRLERLEPKAGLGIETSWRLGGTRLCLGRARFQPSTEQIVDWARRCSEGEHGLTVGPVGEALAAAYEPLKRAWQGRGEGCESASSSERIDTFETLLDQAQLLYPADDAARAWDMENAFAQALHARGRRGEMGPLQEVARKYPELRGIVLLTLSFPSPSLWLSSDDFL